MNSVALKTFCYLFKTQMVHAMYIGKVLFMMSPFQIAITSVSIKFSINSPKPKDLSKSIFPKVFFLFFFFFLLEAINTLIAALQLLHCFGTM